MTPDTPHLKSPVRPLHICELNLPIEHYSPVSGGAISTVIMQRAKHLIAQGHRVSVLSVVNDDPVYEVGNFVPLTMPQRASLPKFRRAFSHFLNRLNHWEWSFYECYIRSFSAALQTLDPVPDVVITHNDMIASRHVKKILPQTPVISWLHNELHRPAHDMPQTIESTDRFIAVSDYIRNWTMQTYPGLGHKIESIHNGVDLQSFFPREDFLEKRKPLRVLFAGRTEPNKGPDLVADAIIQLREEGVPITLTIAGGRWWHGDHDETADPYLCELKSKLEKAQATHLGLVERPAMPAVMRQHDVVCVPSRCAEPFGLVALEGMASGCALITVERGGLPEFCQKAALYIDPDEITTVTTALRRLANDAQLLRDYKQRAIAQATQYSWQVHAHQLERSVLQLKGIQPTSTSL